MKFSVKIIHYFLLLIIRLISFTSFFHFLKHKKVKPHTHLPITMNKNKVMVATSYLTLLQFQEPHHCQHCPQVNPPARHLSPPQTLGLNINSTSLGQHSITDLTC